MDKVIFKGGIETHNVLDQYLRFSTQKIKILVVVDGSIGFLEDGGFSVGRVIRLLRETRLGCSKFIVDIATRSGAIGNVIIMDNPTANQAKYQKFRFDSESNGSLIIDEYDEIFLFGYDGPNSLWAAQDNELIELERWMEKGGGIFATGDHDELGAALCHKIPRVGSMRKWTDEDGVPSARGADRIDTNQPTNPNQSSGNETIPNGVQRDNIPQPIEWITNRTIKSGLYTYRYPHEILCHPQLGIINVMPDHPHEGVCNKIEDIDLNKKLDFDRTKDEYPRKNGHRPEPKIIAYGNVRSDLDYEKGPVTAKRFPMISIYDGRENNDSDLGRVVVDSTWHHWMDMNIDGFDNDSNRNNWDKISRYFLNIAKWLAPKNVFRQYCWWEVVRTHYDYVAVREITKETPILEVGDFVKKSLIFNIGACSVKSLIFVSICDIAPEICTLYERKNQGLPFPSQGPLCLSCPPFELLENYFYGNMYRELEPLAQKIKDTIQSKDKELTVAIDEVEKVAKNAARLGLKEFVRYSEKDLRKYARVLEKARHKIKS